VYSDFGKAVWCAFPSSDFAWPSEGRPAPLTPGIWTTDRMALFGYNPGSNDDGDLAGSYTNNFGGTSSACPGAAGIVALMLSVNPALKAPEVKQILRKACDRIDVANGKYVDDRSDWYGFGRLNAVKAIEAARPVLKPKITVNKIFNQPILDLKSAEATLEIAESLKIDSVAVDVDIKHTFIGDLVLTLVPPNGGSPVVLHNRKGGATKDLRRTFDVANTPALAGYHNASSHGTWRLQVRDEALRDTGLLVSFGLAVQLTSPP
jgi:subtilisin-like proprotein convertase family protein